MPTRERRGEVIMSSYNSFPAMADIFLSYAREDRDDAKRLADELARQGWRVWWDEQIRIGDQWDETIDRELRAAPCVVVLWSAHSVQSRAVRGEARFAADNGRLVPASLDDTPLPLFFTEFQTAQLAKAGGSTAQELDKLFAAVREKVAPHAKQAAALIPEVRRPKSRAASLSIAAAIVTIVIWTAVELFRREGAPRSPRSEAAASAADRRVNDLPEGSVYRALAERVGRVKADQTQCVAVRTVESELITAASCIPQFAVRFVSNAASSSAVLVRKADGVAWLRLSSRAEGAPLLVRRARAGEEIGLLHYRGDEVWVSYGSILQVTPTELLYSAATAEASIGAPIIAASDHALVGLHSGRRGVVNSGIPIADGPRAKLPSDVVASLSAAVGRLNASATETCTAFLAGVAPDRFSLTLSSCIDPERARLWFGDEEGTPFVVQESKPGGYAVLMSGPTGQQAIDMTSRPARLGETVAVMSRPISGPVTVESCIVVEVRPDHFTHDCKLGRATRGAPVFGVTDHLLLGIQSDSSTAVPIPRITIPFDPDFVAQQGLAGE
jgi:hypothetical protein